MSPAAESGDKGVGIGTSVITGCRHFRTDRSTVGDGHRLGGSGHLPGSAGQESGIADHRTHRVLALDYAIRGAFINHHFGSRDSGSYNASHEILVGSHGAIASEHTPFDTAAHDLAGNTAEDVTRIGEVALERTVLYQRVGPLCLANDTACPVVVNIDGMSLGYAACFDGGIVGIADAAAAELPIESGFSFKDTITERGLVHPSHQPSGITAVGVGADGNSALIRTHMAGDHTILYVTRLCIAHQSAAVNVFAVHIGLLQLEVLERCTFCRGNESGRLPDLGRDLQVLDAVSVGIVASGKASPLGSRSERAAGHIDRCRLPVESTGELGGLGAIGVFRPINKVLRRCNKIRFRLSTLAAAEKRLLRIDSLHICDATALDRAVRVDADAADGSKIRIVNRACKAFGKSSRRRHNVKIRRFAAQGYTFPANKLDRIARSLGIGYLHRSDGIVGSVYLGTATSPKDNGGIVFGNLYLPDGGTAGKIKPEQAEQMRQADGTAGFPRCRSNVAAGVKTTRNIVLLSGEIQHQLGVAGFRGDGSIRIDRHIRACRRSLSAEYGLFGIRRNLVG